jgi:hypothetical protein
MRRLLQFTPHDGKHVFSNATYSTWDSRVFRERFAYPLLERQRQSGEPTLQIFSDVPGHRIRDHVTSMHSWRSGGRSRFSRPPRHNTMQPWHIYRKWDARLFQERRKAYKDGRADNGPALN